MRSPRYWHPPRPLGHIIHSPHSLSSFLDPARPFRPVKKLAKTADITEYFLFMNAMEVIDQFKRLSREEQSKVVEFIQKDCSAKVRYAGDEAAMTAAKAVFGEHPELFRKLAQ